MTDKELMSIALDETQKSNEPLKCGVVISKEGVIIASGFNSQREDKNATAHAEIKAIAEAGKVLGQKDLVGCIAYCTCEPCTMCLSAFVFAKIDTIYYRATLSEVSSTHIRITSDELLLKAPRRVKMRKLT
jgi:tRNA(Arg) A34 adenosine deaminase TadA